MAGAMGFKNATGILPSEIVPGVAGWMLLAAHDAPSAGILIGGLYAARGSSAGASATCWRPMMDRRLRVFLVDPRHIRRAETPFQGWGPGSVLPGRMLPGARTWITIPAGLAGSPFPLFIGLTLVGSYLWCRLLIVGGYTLGHEWGVIRELVRRAAAGIIAVLLVPGDLGWRRRRAVLRDLPAGARRWTAGEADSMGGSEQ